jgi:hypothetical protein
MVASRLSRIATISPQPRRRVRWFGIALHGLRRWPAARFERVPHVFPRAATRHFGRGRTRVTTRQRQAPPPHRPTVDGIEEVTGWSPLCLSATFATARSEGADLSLSHDGRFAVLILFLQLPGEPTNLSAHSSMTRQRPGRSRRKELATTPELDLEVRRSLDILILCGVVLVLPVPTAG